MPANGPVDPDIENGRPTAPAFPPWRHIVLVAAGGFVGTAARAMIAATVPALGGFPVGILAVNSVGSFALGLVVHLLAARGADEGRRRLTRLGVGTGVIGGFTTYSAVTVDTAQLASTAAPWMAATYLLLTMLLGAVASFGGILAGTWWGRIGR